MLGGVLVLTGLLFFAPIALFYFVFAQHMYTIGLSFDPKAIEVLLGVVVVAGIAMTIGGITLLRRS